MSTIKVGVVGYGFAAKNFHLPFITANNDYQVIAILQRAEAPKDPSSAAPGSHCKVDFPNIRHYRTEEEFFADPDTQLVVVATHTDTHASFAEKALRAGKHGMCKFSAQSFHVMMWDLTVAHSNCGQAICEIIRGGRPCHRACREKGLNSVLFSKPEMGK